MLVRSGNMSRTLTAEDLWSIPRVGAPQIDRSGTVLVVPVTTYDADGNAVTRLWRLVGGDAVPLTGTAESAAQPAISPDGTHVAFVRKVDDIRQIHVMRVDGGEPEQVSDMPLGAFGPKWFPDGDELVCLSHVYRDASTLEEVKARKAELEERPYDVHVSEKRFFRYWDDWLTAGQVPHLWKIDLDTRHATDLTPDSRVHWDFESTGAPAEHFDISPDGNEVAYSAFRSDDDDVNPTYAVRTVPAAGGAVRIVSGDGPGNAVRPRYTLDGTGLVYGRQLRDDFYADRRRLTLLDRASGEERALLPAWDRSPDAWAVGADAAIFFVAEDAGQTKLFRLDRDAVAAVELTKTGSASAVAVGGDRVVFGHESFRAPPEIFEVVNGAPIRLSHFTASALEGIDLGQVDSKVFSGAAGADVQMYVMTPPNFVPGPKRPLVHLIHGGPHGLFGDGWHWRWNPQVIAAAGYVVAMVNFHGSTSWGQAFAESILGGWGDKPLADIEAATDLLISEGLIDQERMAVTGGSYGGYLVAWITSQTSRYRCAIAHAAVTNLGGMNASDYAFHRATAFGAEYWADPERVDRWSPSTHAVGYETPTLVIHGERDYRVPVTQGLELYAALKSKGVDARLVHYPGEHHWILGRHSSVHWYSEFLDWLARHLWP